MAATIKDIAKKTGLGLATISSYINGGNVRKDNKNKIEAAIEELHYEINEVARGLKTNRTKTIGVVIPELSNLFCTEIITGIEDILRKHGYATIVCDCRTDKNLEQAATEFLYRKRVDGIINMPVNESGEHLRIFQNAGRPIVLIDRKIENLECDSVFVDNEMAAKKAVHLLIEHGHQKIGLIGGPVNVFTAQERLLGYKKALEEKCLAVEERLIYHGDYDVSGGVAGVEYLVHNNPDMTALFVTNYEMTMGAVIAVNEQGISIPKELSLIGFDNLSFARACNPKLTIVTQPTGDIARYVADIMLQRLGESDIPVREEENRRLQTDIVQGKSVGRIKNKTETFR